MRETFRPSSILRRAVLLVALLAFAVPGLAAATGGLCFAADGALMPACGVGADGHDRGCCGERTPVREHGCCGEAGSDESGCVDVPAPEGPAAPTPTPPGPPPAPEVVASVLPSLLASFVAPALDAPSPVADPPPRWTASGGTYFLRV